MPSVIFSTGGTVQASGGVYIARPADDELFQLCLRAEYANVLTSRQMGKSSLRVAVSERLRQEGIHIASIDLTSIGTQADSPEQWYVSLLERIEEDLGVATPVLDWWEAHQRLTPTDRFTRYLLEIALAEVTGQVVIFVDEIDSTLSLPFGADDFFAAIRALYNARAENPDAPRLSFVLIGSVAPGDLIRDSSRTPFNIGRGVALTDFSEAAAQPLAAGLALPPLERRDLLHRIFQWTGGHPYLTQRLAMAAAQDSQAARDDLEGLVSRTFLVSGDKKDSNLEWVRDMLSDRAPDREAVLTTWRDVLRGGRVKDEEASVAKSHLKLTGVVSVVGGLVKPRNRIYTSAFDDAWVLRHLPQDLERQRKLVLYQRVALIAVVAIFVLVGVAVAMFGLWSQARLAESAAASAKAVAVRERDNARNSEVRVSAALREGQAQFAEAQKQHDRAEVAVREALARRLATQSEYLKPTQPVLAGLLALESAQRLSLRENRNGVAASLGFTSSKRHLRHQALVNALAISPDGNWLATASDDKTARIWDARTGRERARLEHQNPVSAVAISPDGKWLATASSDNMARIWDAATGRERARLEHRDRVNAVAISPNGRWLATASDDNTARIWDAATGRERARLEHQHRVNAVAISLNGQWLATASDDKTAHTWVLTAGWERVRFQHQYSVTAVAISSDGRRVVTATDDKIAHIFRIWDWNPSATADRTVRFFRWDKAPRLRHQDSVTTVAISSDGQWIATGSSDHTARIWDDATASEYLTLQFPNAPRALSFLYNFYDRPLLAIAHGNEVTLEPWQTEHLINDLCASLPRNLTLAEWKQYLGDEPYRPTCPNLRRPEGTKETASK